jgi:hypothetical protein
MSLEVAVKMSNAIWDLHKKIMLITDELDKLVKQRNKLEDDFVEYVIKEEMNTSPDRVRIPNIKGMIPGDTMESRKHRSLLMRRIENRLLDAGVTEEFISEQLKRVLL